MLRVSRSHLAARSLLATVVGIGLCLSPPALATRTSEGSSTDSGRAPAEVSGQEVSVQVQSTSVNGGAGGGLGTEDLGFSAGVSVHPVCWWSPGRSGRQMAESIEKGDYDALVADGTMREDTDKHFEGWADHKDDDKGRWWHATCSSAYFEGDYQDLLKLYEEFTSGGSVRFIPDGGEPPKPPVPGVLIAQAVRRSLRVPSPSVDTNPVIGPNGATVVGVPTWVWATPATIRTATITATAGATTATVTITANGLSLSAPSSTTTTTPVSVAEIQTINKPAK